MKPARASCVLLVLTATIAAAEVVTAPAASLTPTTVTPTGEYQLVHLHLVDGTSGINEATRERIRASKTDLDITVGFRDGKAVTAWFRGLWTTDYWPLEMDLTITDGTLKGTIAGHTGGAEGGTGPACERFSVEFDARETGATLSGTYRHTFALTPPVEFTGTLTGRLVEGQPLASGKDWPHYYGAPDSCSFQSPSSGLTLIADLSQAKPLWKSESWILAGYGSGPDGRYAHTAGFKGLNGSSSSPVVSGGRVFQFHYRPSPISTMQKDNPYDPWKDDLALKEKLLNEKYPDTPIARQWWVDFFRITADDVVTCMDASTGQTLWETTLPMRNMNLQTHKHRGFYSAPLVSDGVIYAGPNLMGRVYALDASSGRLLWEHPEPVTGQEQTTGNKPDWAILAPGPVRINGTVIVNGRIGIDAKTGVKRWESQEIGATPVFPVVVGGKTLALRGIGQDGRGKAQLTNALLAFDPLTGETVWRHANFPHVPREVVLLSLVGDRLLSISWNDEFPGKVPGVDDGEGTLHCFRVKADGLEALWTAPCPNPLVAIYALAVDGTHAYVVGGKSSHCYDLTTGQIVGKVDGVGGARTQIAMLAEGRLIVSPEGRHGRQFFLMASADPKDFRELPPSRSEKTDYGSSWVPPHPSTTAYACQPLNHCALKRTGCSPSGTLRTEVLRDPFRTQTSISNSSS